MWTFCSSSYMESHRCHSWLIIVWAGKSAQINTPHPPHLSPSSDLIWLECLQSGSVVKTDPFRLLYIPAAHSKRSRASPCCIAAFSHLASALSAELFDLATIHSALGRRDRCIESWGEGRLSGWDVGGEGECRKGRVVSADM